MPAGLNGLVFLEYPGGSAMSENSEQLYECSLTDWPLLLVIRRRDPLLTVTSAGLAVKSGSSVTTGAVPSVSDNSAGAVTSTSALVLLGAVGLAQAALKIVNAITTALNANPFAIVFSLLVRRVVADTR